MKHLIIASTSTVFGGAPLDYILDALTELYKNTDTILFIPYARPGGISHEEYTNNIQLVFNKINKKVVGIHEFESPTEALQEAKGIYVGGGNTFVLVSQLYKSNCINTLKEVVLKGTPYLGTSAGSNICGLTMSTTNDMPIVYPPSFKTLGFVPFNINPHYLDPIGGNTHMGETRETRIKEFHHYNTPPVVGLREGSWIEIKGDTMLLKGPLKAIIFEYKKTPFEIETGTSLKDIK
ncbi:dipeptidase PepE [Bizionia gelidisalsuginis]|uniref:Dipeptidase PepE n=2 Tax=Bizionia TaxID=283785 RepID=A0A8H2LP86_9FLAO|nr:MULTISPECIES: dipeptidase PepE [Bizionia]TYB78025.1 dipeptidase PepE [Bizionia saleffrena]TYC12671.1 dipeptidase PepE [Bizionia gelidisalsuginis]